MSGTVRAGGAVLIPASVQKIIQDIKEIAGNHSDEEIYAMLKDCNMDPNETAQKLLFQGRPCVFAFCGFFVFGFWLKILHCNSLLSHHETKTKPKRYGKKGLLYYFSFRFLGRSVAAYVVSMERTSVLGILSKKTINKF